MVGHEIIQILSCYYVATHRLFCGLEEQVHMSLLLKVGVDVTASCSFCPYMGLYVSILYSYNLLLLLNVCMLINDIIHMYASTEAFL